MSAGGTAARAAISQAGPRLGHGDPIAVADELLAVDVGALRAWSGLTASAQRALTAGADRLADALPVLADAWSSPAPRQAVLRHRTAGLTAADVIRRQVDAAQEAVGVLDAGRIGAELEVSQAEGRINRTGWPPGEDLLSWAAGHGQLPVVSDTVGSLAGTLQRLRLRNDDALRSLADALRADPAEQIETLAAGQPSAAPTPGSAGGPGVDGASGSTDIDRANLGRLAADLRSPDISVRIAAMGVRAALDRARAEGGQAQLLVYESAGATSQGRAAISVGDITRADRVVALAPGVSSSPATMADGIGGALALRDRTRELDPFGRTAVISWYGYDVPLAAFGGSPMTLLATAENTALTVNDLAARAGGQQLVQDLAGFRASAPGDARFIGVGFSMGSTTVSAAAARQAHFDDLVLLGSPGASREVDTADDYPGMSAEHVWVGSLDNDPITTGITDDLAGIFNGLGLNPLMADPFGPDPANADFGAKVLDLSSNVPDPSVELSGPFGWLVNPLLNDVADLSAHHQEANYLSGASLDALASIVIGRYDDVPLRPGR